MKLPIEVEHLPVVDQLVIEAVYLEQKKSTDVMERTLRGYGWSAVQAAFVAEKWSWPWLVRAIVGERAKRGQEPVNHAALDVVQRAQPGAVAVRTEAAWVEQHGEVVPPRPLVAASAPGTPGASIRLPARSLPDHLRDPVAREADEPDRSERL